MNMLRNKGSIILRNAFVRGLGAHRVCNGAYVTDLSTLDTPCHLRSTGKRWLSSSEKGPKSDFASMLKNIQSGGGLDKAEKSSTPVEATAGKEPAVNTETPSSGTQEQRDTSAVKEQEGDGTSGEESMQREKSGAEAEAKNAETPAASQADRFRSWMNSIDISSLIQSLPARTRLLADDFVEGTKLAWDELRNPKKHTVLEKKVQQASSFKKTATDEDSEKAKSKDEEEEKPKERGPSALVHVKEPTSQWDAMKARLADSPVIKEIFKRSKVVYKQAAATDAGAAAAAAADKVKDKISDAKEFWETSQNPIIYTLSGVWDNVTGETEEGLCTKELLKLDPSFNKEEWMEEVRTQLAPQTINAHLEGDLKFLQQHCGEACYAKLSNDVKMRQSDKVTFESKMVDLDENLVIMKFLESGQPVIVCMYMVQQINVIRKDGEVVEGNPNQVIARFYSMAFQQEYDDDEGIVRWKITDYEYGGDMPYY